MHDIVLLAPSASALRRMLSVCDSYATSHGLVFNAGKTQLICFRSWNSATQLPTILFNNTKMCYVDSALHLSHILTFNLDNREDIV